MELVKQLRDAGKGVEEWRVADPADGSYCISFSWTDCANPEREAREWLEDHRRRFPNGRYAHYEVRRVMEQYRADRLMCQAADEIERLREENKRLRQVTMACWGALAELSPCAHEECCQPQTEALDLALRMAEAELKHNAIAQGREHSERPAGAEGYAAGGNGERK